MTYDVTQHPDYIKTVTTLLDEEDIDITMPGGVGIMVVTHIMNNGDEDTEEQSSTYTLTTISLVADELSASLNIGYMLDTGMMEKHLQKLKKED